MKECIYALCEPDGRHTVRYVGRTKDLTARVIGHRSSRGPLGHWLRAIIKSGKQPSVRILSRSSAVGEEMRFISKFWSSNLFNKAAPSFTKRVTRDGITLYPVDIFVTEKVIRAADARIRSERFRRCRSRAAVLSQHAELLAINRGTKR